ncbi:MAG: patatin-like phospholipase family protein [Parashewanella sp.]
MKTRHLILIACSLVAFSFTSIARPKVGLALSGGGAKGAAHVGVLKILEQHHIPIDYIAGTSIGAYVGGLYALGYTADEIQQLMLETNWLKGYSDLIPRQSLSYRDKQHRDQYNVPIPLGVNNGELQSPSGLLQGQTMSRLLRDSTGLVKNFNSFDELSIPFRAVATDIVTSKPVVLDSENIVFAMQASASVPGALEPAVWHDKLLVDGGIANNMPVDVVKAMGADIVIAVDIGSSLISKDKLTNTLKIIEQLSTILTNASTARQKALLTDKDILLRPKVGRMSTTDFSILKKALKLGEESAVQGLSELTLLSISAQEYASYQLAKMAKAEQWLAPIEQPISALSLINQSKVSDTLILDTFAIKEGEIINKQQLDKAIERVYALNKFERVNAEFNDTAQGRELILTTKAKSWGPNYFQLGLNLEDDYSLGVTVSLDLDYTMTDITTNGGEWRNSLKLGSTKQFASEFYQPLDEYQQWYSKARYQFTKQNRGVFEKNDLTYGLDYQRHLALVSLGHNFGKTAFAELGFRGLVGKVKNKALQPSRYDIGAYGGYFIYGYDALDSISFPTSGDRLTVKVKFGREDVTQTGQQFNSDFKFHYLVDWKGALSFGHHALVAKMAFETESSKKDDYLAEPAQLGGFLNLSGYHKNSLVGNHKLFGALIYQYDLGRDVLGLRGYPLYVGSSIEAGNVWHERQQMKIDDLIYSGSLYLGTDTELGPAALGFGWSNEGEKALYLFLGKNF